MRLVSALLLAFAALGCSNSGSGDPICRPLSTSDRHPSAETLRSVAGDLAADAHTLRLRIAQSSTATGLAGTIFRRVAGTEAYDIGFQLKSLRERVAYQVAMEQAYWNDGTVLVPMAESWACKALADSVVSLDAQQGSERLQENLGIVERRFGLNYLQSAPEELEQ